MTNTFTKIISYDSFDLLKIILSILIVQIHSDFYVPWMKPYLRLAVPLFFIISAYFFFRKNPTSKNLLSYIKRLCILYIFWFFVWGPYFLYSNRYEFSEGVLNGSLFFLKSLFWGSTFAASWYITASIVGTVIVFYLSKFFSNIVLLIISSIIYSITTLSTSYYGLFSDSIGIVDNWYNTLTNTHLSISFPVSLLWIVIGKLLAGFNRLHKRKGLYIFLTLLSLVLLQVEYRYVAIYHRLDDCFFFLIPTCIFIFFLFQSFFIHIPYSIYLRSISTIVYCSHYSIIAIFSTFIKVFNENTFNQFEKFLIGIVGSVIISATIVYLERKKSFTWLKYSH